MKGHELNLLIWNQPGLFLKGAVMNHKLFFIKSGTNTEIVQQLVQKNKEKDSAIGNQQRNIHEIPICHAKIGKPEPCAEAYKKEQAGKEIGDAGTLRECVDFPGRICGKLRQ